MKIEERVGGAEERNILIGMITDRTVLGRIAEKWSPGEELFKSKWSNLISGWCVRYYKKYGKAPMKHIEGLYETWEAKNDDKSTSKAVEKLLGLLSGEYVKFKKQSNTDYLIDLAAEHFNKVKIAKLRDALDDDLQEGDPAKAFKRISSYNQVEMGAGAGIDVLRDQEAMRQAFESNTEPLITYQGGLGRFMGNALERDGFVGIMGPEKRGKTWWLMDIAWNAMLQRRRVAFFEVGDMSQNQIMRRFMTRAAKYPLKLPEKGTPILWPSKIEKDPEGGKCLVDHKEMFFKKALSWGMGFKACEDIINKTRSKKCLLRLSVHPARSISVLGIKSCLQNWERLGWAADVVVIDYADILAPIQGGLETRHQIDATWAELRGLSQTYHCLVVTATQSDAKSYMQETLDRSNFSEDKRKFAHVTAMLGLNQTPEEKELGVIRLNKLALREDGYSESRCVYVAGCLALANPAVKSVY